MGYLEACEAAAERQGINAILRTLRGAGVPAEWEQTGGFTMVAVAQTEGGVVVVTDDVDHYLLGSYPGETWTEGSDEEAAPGMIPVGDTDSLVAAVRALQGRLNGGDADLPETYREMR